MLPQVTFTHQTHIQITLGYHCGIVNCQVISGLHYNTVHGENLRQLYKAQISPDYISVLLFMVRLPQVISEVPNMVRLPQVICELLYMTRLPQGTIVLLCMVSSGHYCITVHGQDSKSHHYITAHNQVTLDHYCITVDDQVNSYHYNNTVSSGHYCITVHGQDSKSHHYITAHNQVTLDHYCITVDGQVNSYHYNNTVSAGHYCIAVHGQDSKSHHYITAHNQVTLDHYCITVHGQVNSYHYNNTVHDHVTPEVLNVIWTCREGPDSEIIGTTNGHNLYIADLKTLKPETELNDQDELEKYDVAIGCVNENDVHWIAIIFDIRSKIIVIMDPLEEGKTLPRKQKAIEKCFNKEKRMGTWTAQVASDYPIQDDGTSCGVFCLKFIERHLLREDTNSLVNVNSERVDIGKCLILSLQPKPFLSCYVCIHTPFNMRRCCKCMRTFHKDCKIPVTCTVCCHLNTSKTLEDMINHTNIQASNFLGNSVEKKRTNVFDAEHDAEPPSKSLKVQQGQVTTKTVFKGTNKKEEDTEDLGLGTTMKDTKITDKKEEDTEDLGLGTTMKDTKITDKKEEGTVDLEENEITDWGTIQTLADLKKSNIRAVASRLQCTKTNKASRRMIHVITGGEFLERIGNPEYFTNTQLGNYLCLSKSDNSRKEMTRLVDLVPKSGQPQAAPVTSAWSQLTKGDVQYQMNSLAELSESCLDGEKIGQKVLNKMTGGKIQKEAAVENTKQVMKLLMEEIKTTTINTAMHGNVMEAFWDVFERLLPKTYVVFPLNV
ncbi:unnamed protein product [Mytilus coruscus]|uniref:Ubiquitin-like protease family profile domain-containing protein n=1 Tax=Mytilus coruscus TaxID=42192 RepID=A0A6J8BFR9_MYTCO|nr:unnamed protein product [Mytilus coruscus]